MLRKTLYIILMFSSAISLQAMSDAWLVKGVVAFDGTLWRKVELTYDASERVAMARIFSSCDNELWSKQHTCTFVYDGQSNRIASRVDYAFSGDADSAVVWRDDISYTAADAGMVSQSFDALTGTSCTTTHSVPTEQGSSCSSDWTFSDNGTAHTDVAYRYCNQELDAVDYSFTGASGIGLRYRCRFIRKSPSEHYAFWQTFVGNSWVDSICSRSFYDAQGHLVGTIQYLCQDTILLPQTKTVYRYDADGNMLSYELLAWQGEFWQALKREVCGYAGFAVCETVTYQDYRYHGWRDVATAAYSYNSDLLLDRVVTDAAFWSESDNDVLRTIGLPENLSSHSIMASEAEFSYIPKSACHIDNPGFDLTEMNVFPNPSSTGLFRIKDLRDADLRYDVYSSCGMSLLSGSLVQGVIDMRSLPDGLYLVCIRNGSQCVTRKLIISR